MIILWITIILQNITCCAYFDMLSKNWAFLIRTCTRDKACACFPVESVTIAPYSFSTRLSPSRGIIVAHVIGEIGLHFVVALEERARRHHGAAPVLERRLLALQERCRGAVSLIFGMLEHGLRALQQFRVAAHEILPPVHRLLQTLRLISQIHKILRYNHRLILLYNTRLRNRHQQKLFTHMLKYCINSSS